MSTINDYYNAFMINKRASKHYGVEVKNPSSSEFVKDLLAKLDGTWIDGFDLETFQLGTEKSVTGVTFDSL